MSNVFRLCISTLLLSLLPGCVTAIGDANRDLLTLMESSPDGMTFDQLVDHIAIQVVKFSTAEDLEDTRARIVTWSLAGVALGAAGGLTYGASSDYLAGMALGGSGIGLIDQIEHPTSNRDAYHKAVDKFICLVDASIPQKNRGPQKQKDGEQSLFNLMSDAEISGILEQTEGYSQSIKSAESDARKDDESISKEALDNVGLVASQQFLASETSAFKTVFATISATSDSSPDNRKDILLTAYRQVISTLQTQVRHNPENLDKLVKELYEARDRYTKLRKAAEEGAKKLQDIGLSSGDATLLADKVLDIASYQSQTKNCSILGDPIPAS